MKTILITGGCSFIGSNFVRLALKSLPKVVCNSLAAKKDFGLPMFVVD